MTSWCPVPWASIRSCCGGLVDAVDHLLQVVGDLVCVGLQIVVAEILAGKVIEIGQKFHGRHRTGKLRTDGKHQIDERATERGQMLGCLRLTAQPCQPVQQKGIQRDGDAVGLEAGFIVHVDFMRLDLAQIFICRLLVEDLGNLA